MLFKVCFSYIDLNSEIPRKLQISKRVFAFCFLFSKWVYKRQWREVPQTLLGPQTLAWLTSMIGSTIQAVKFST